MGILAGYFSLILAVFSSRNESNYATFQKFAATNSGYPVEYWMPLWSKDEMDCCKLLPHSPACKQQRAFDKYWEEAGGKLRCWSWSLSKIKTKRVASLKRFTPGATQTSRSVRATPKAAARVAAASTALRGLAVPAGAAIANVRHVPHRGRQANVGSVHCVHVRLAGARPPRSSWHRGIGHHAYALQ